MTDVVVVPHVDDPIVVTPHVDETPTYVPHTTVVPMVHTAPNVAANNANGQIPMWGIGVIFLALLLAVGTVYLLVRD